MYDFRRKFMKKPSSSGAPRSFVEFILEPFYKIFSQVQCGKVLYDTIRYNKLPFQNVSLYSNNAQHHVREEKRDDVCLFMKCDLIFGTLLLTVNIMKNIMKCGLLNQDQACDRARTHHLYLCILTPTFQHKSGRAIQWNNGITTVQSAK